MRLWTALVFGGMLIPAAQAQESAQKLYEAMEQKLAKAKAHKIEITSDFFAGGEARSLQGTLIVAEGNCLKIAMEVKHPKRHIKLLWVSDGKTLFTKEEKEGKPSMQAGPVPEQLGEQCTLVLGRGGVLLLLLSLESQRGDIKDGAALKPHDFKMLAKEKVGDRQALVIEYRLSFPQTKDPATCKVWLDPDTRLPLKRTLELPQDGAVFRAAETYGRWELDPKLPEGTFALPK
jgi:hypothetical protein